MTKTPLQPLPIRQLVDIRNTTTRVWKQLIKAARLGQPSVHDEASSPAQTQESCLTEHYYGDEIASVGVEDE